MKLLAAALLAATGAWAADYAPPPRTVDDILAVLDQYKPDPAEVEKRTRAASLEPPATSDHVALAKFYLDRGHARGALGQISGQIADLRAALEHGRQAPDSVNLFPILEDLASAERGGGNFVTAVERTKEANELAQQMRRPGQLMMTFSGLAASHSAMGDLEASKAYLARAEGIYSKIRMGPAWPEYGELWTASLERSRGYVYLREGQYAAAEAALRKSLAAWDAGRDGNTRRYRSGQPAMVPGRYLLQRNIVQTALARSMAAQGRLAEAEATTREALIKNLSFFGRYSTQAGGMLGALSHLLAEEGRFREATLVASAAQDSIERSGAGPESIVLANARSALGASLVAQGKWQDAIATYEKRQDGLAHDPLLVRQFGRGDINWGYALVKVGQAGRAVPMLRELLKSRESQLGEKDRSVAELRGYLAIALAANGERDSALAEFRRAVPQLLEAVRADQDTETGGTASWMRTTNVLEGYLELLSQRPDAQSAAEAFRVADVARGSSVQRALAESAARSAIRDPALADIARKAQDTEHRIGVLSGLLPRLLAAPPEQQLTKVIADARRDLDELRKDQLALRRDIERRFPAYAALTSPRPPTVEEVQALLRPNEALVSIYAGADRTYAWGVPQKGAIAFTAAPIGRQALAQRVDHLREALDVADASLANFPKFDLAASYALYAEILKPLEPALANANSLLVAPHGALGRLPFAVLTTAPHVLKPDDAAAFATYREAPWLIKRAAITQLPSVATLATLRRASPPSTGRRQFVGFGDPVFTKAQMADAAAPGKAVTRGVRLRNLGIAKVETKTALESDAGAETTAHPGPVAVANSSGLAQLAPLPDTSEEILRIAEVLGAAGQDDVYLRLRASESVLKKTDLAHRRVIAFATHGLVPGDLDGLTQPALALSSPDVVGGDDDGLLTMEEILGLKLDADWVVLSACNTASGEGAGAEAVSGLGRAFFFAGARALLVSNWPVETTSARMLTTGIFRTQAARPTLSRAEALRQTMLDLMNGPGPENGAWGFTYAHPMFWAPFSLVGEGSER